MIKCGIIGAGAWGSAISTLIGCDKILIWSRNKTVVKSINKKRLNPYLKGIKLPKNLFATNSIKDLQECDYFFIATPTQFTRKILTKLKKYKIKKNFIICSKGIENKSCKFLSNIIKEVFPNSKIAIMSGPSFAIEVANKLPTAVLVASKEKNFFNNISKLINKKYFRLYFSNDIIGCQLGGAIKNIYAIGAGMLQGLKLGENAKSAFVSRSFAEILRFSKKFGAKEKTFFGLSGLGDLILTCNSSKSRNTNFGKLITNNKKSINKIIKKNKTITEGYYSIKPIYEISKKNKIDMPILKSIYKILYKNSNMKKEIELILGRSIKKEFY